MQIDELRGELAALADEMAPFAGDVRALHRRALRRRVVASAAAVVLVVAVTVSTVAIARRDAGGRIQVTTPPPAKLASASRLTRVDAVVVADTPAVEALLDGSPLVDAYTRVPRTVPTGGPTSQATNPSLLVGDDTHAAVCALLGSGGLAVEAKTPGAGFGRDIAALLAGRGRAYPLEFEADFEIFFKVGAPTKTVDADLRVVRSDDDVASVRLVTQQEAYEIFKHDFASQPALVASTKPSDLPVSFRVAVRLGADVARVQSRYQSGGIVDTVVANPSTRILDPSQRQLIVDTAACATH